MKKLILSVFATIAIYALVYLTWSFALGNFNPKDWEVSLKILCCYTSVAVSTIVIIGIILCVDEK